MTKRSALTLVLATPDNGDIADMLTRLEAVSHPLPEPVMTSGPGADSPDAKDSDRRRARRRPAEQFGQDLRISLPGAAEARAIDVSSTGVLAETTQRLCPGRTVDLFLRLNGTRRVVRARVVRSTVHAVSPRTIFRAALQFEDACTLPECAD